MNPQILSDIDKHEIGRFSVVQVAVCIQTIKFKINQKVYQVDKQNDFKILQYIPSAQAIGINHLT